MLYIYDMGGVVLHGVFEMIDIMKEQGWTGDPHELYVDDLMDDLSAGRLDEAQYWQAFNRRYGTKVSSARWGETYSPELDSSMVALVRELRREHRVVCGTNTFESHYRVSRERGDYDCFDRVYASHRMGVAKPDPQFWTTILEEENFPAEEAVFIDDFAVNVKAAEGQGLRAFLFRDLPSLRSDLKSLSHSS